MEPNPMDLLRLATEQGADVDKLEKLMALQERWEARIAEKAFFAALTEFQAECPDLRKTKPTEFNGKVQYYYAPLGDIDRQIKGLLRKFSLTKRWEFQDKGEEIFVTCVVTHSGGHSERTTMMAKPDPSGSKNAIQARGSTIEYLKRYTLVGALGLTTADQDIDGRLPEQDLDKLHKQFMEVYNQLIQVDEGYTKYSVDNWKGERTPKNYVKATGELRKILERVTPKEL